MKYVDDQLNATIEYDPDEGRLNIDIDILVTGLPHPRDPDAKLRNLRDRLGDIVHIYLSELVEQMHIEYYWDEGHPR